MQFKAGLKKEFIYFAKSFRMYGVILAMLAFALLSPLMIKATSLLREETQELVEGAEVTEETEVVEEVMMDCPECGYGITYTDYDEAMYQQMTEEMSEEGASIDELFNSFDSVSYGIALVLSGISADAVLVLLLCMMSTAGGEQKKRNVIIPNASGLTTWGYILPKFVFYTIFTFVSTFAVAYLGYFMCTWLYDATLPALDVFNYIICNSVFCVFVVILYLFAGLSTGKAGLSAALVYIFLNIFPSVLEFAEINEYNPFSLMKYAFGTNMTIDGKEIAISMLITVGLSALFIGLTYLFVNLRRIDNTRKVEIADVSDN